MESMSILEKSSLFLPKDTIHPSELIDALHYYADKIDTLSLDCFDTLLWRKTALPTDVFYDLQEKPLFKHIQFDAFLRIHFELKARYLKLVKEKNTEVTLHDIYRIGYPTLSSEELNALAEEELQTEMETCHVFLPIANLIREAKKIGLNIIIVSNTYLKENQLRRLLENCLPLDVMQSINMIHCSSRYGVSKENGLFKKIVDKHNLKPDKILHIGDNQHADLSSARQSGLYAMQLIPFQDNINEALRFYAAASSLFNPDIRHSQSLPSPFRAIFASTTITEPEEIIGYTSIGPIMYAFSEFIIQEINELKKNGRNPKVLFLMRDAYLLSLSCDELYGESFGTKIRISRFTTNAATFRTKENIDQYLSEVIFSCRFRDIAKQLLLPDYVTEQLISNISQSNNPIVEFISFIQRNEIIQMIIKNSSEYRKRLTKYLIKEINLQKNDTLVFVDIGYSGSIQTKLEPVFKEELEVDTFGLYLMELATPNRKKSRKGMISPDWCDNRAILSLIKYIALFEQICTCNENSSVDYDKHGNVIYSMTSLQSSQHAKIAKIQKECLRFVRDARKNFDEIGKLSIKTLRETAFGELSRLIYLPTEIEVKYFKSLEFDLNLGTEDVLELFDLEKGLNSLRKRGLFFANMERNYKTLRTNYPAELRSAGLELAMTLMSQSRFTIDLGLKDMSLRREKLRVAAIENNQTTQAEVEALLTYDGYYSLVLPVKNQQFHLGIFFGQKYEWIQVENAEFIEIDSFLKIDETLHTTDCWSNLIFHEMNVRGKNLYECSSIASSVVVTPKNSIDNKNSLLRLIFRPLVYRPVQ